MSDWYILSRPRGRVKWYRHIPGYASRQAAEDRAKMYAEAMPGSEFDVQEYATGPAPTYPNGQVKGRQRRRRRGRS